MHIELTEMLRCPEPHREDAMVLSTGEMIGRMVRSGLVGCSVCRKEFFIKDGIVDFVGSEEPGAGSRRTAVPPTPGALLPTPTDLQALLELSGPGGFVVLLGDATRFAASLAGLMAGIHFVGVNAPADTAELPILSLLRSSGGIPLRQSFARGVVVGADLATSPWLVEAHRILLRGRRFVTLHEKPELPIGLEKLATAKGLWVGEKK
ncbi:MAG TPA: hypothetical protein VGQ18_09270 [Gemmatimonadales bacterium]|jgi:hypothetical protein|nr:hypothetical protein [Gemmatimonadales bacterium]